MTPTRNLLALGSALGATLALAPQLATAQTYVVDPSASSVTWTGSKVIGGGHTGTVDLASGTIVLDDGVLTGGTFAADMQTIAVTDLSGSAAEKLAGHLFSGDFFDTAEHPGATFAVTSVEPTGQGAYAVTGDLTIKGETHAVTFPATLSTEGDRIVASGTATVDRTKYGVRYGSDSFFDNLGDKAIANDFELDIKLVANQ